MMSTLFMTTLSISRERERGTMENLLAMPLRPIEVMISKMVPYVFIGYIQVLLILAFSVFFFSCRSGDPFRCCCLPWAYSCPVISLLESRSRLSQRPNCRRPNLPSLS